MIEAGLTWEFMEHVSDTALAYATLPLFPPSLPPFLCNLVHILIPLCISHTTTVHRMRALRTSVESSSDEDGKHSTIQPGAAWADLLVRSALIDVLAVTYQTVHPFTTSLTSRSETTTIDLLC